MTFLSWESTQTFTRSCWRFFIVHSAINFSRTPIHNYGDNYSDTLHTLIFYWHDLTWSTELNHLNSQRVSNLTWTLQSANFFFLRTAKLRKTFSCCRFIFQVNGQSTIFFPQELSHRGIVSIVVVHCSSRRWFHIFFFSRNATLQNSLRCCCFSQCSIQSLYSILFSLKLPYCGRVSLEVSSFFKSRLYFHIYIYQVLPYCRTFSMLLLHSSSQE